MTWETCDILENRCTVLTEYVNAVAHWKPVSSLPNKPNPV